MREPIGSAGLAVQARSAVLTGPSPDTVSSG